ncbi:hypothetical protein CLF_110383 [Clonorchis sinensis]|uniref:Uncharacterized protein n=1 Tax=Clonorchis sinensis TaxID=79923 RepID=G7YKL9_CLOSI|nr:hypothetical protein CLF_110383 [Clonorchis sinensis]
MPLTAYETDYGVALSNLSENLFAKRNFTLGGREDEFLYFPGQLPACVWFCEVISPAVVRSGMIVPKNASIQSIQFPRTEVQWFQLQQLRFPSIRGISVCEEVMREPWVDGDAGTRRRQYSGFTASVGLRTVDEAQAPIVFIRNYAKPELDPSAEERNMVGSIYFDIFHKRAQVTSLFLPLYSKSGNFSGCIIQLSCRRLFITTSFQFSNVSARNRDKTWLFRLSVGNNTLSPGWNQAALSAGRLRRMELAPSHWNERPQSRLGDARPAQPVHSELTSLPEARHSKATGMYNHYHHHGGQARPNSTTPAVPHPVIPSHSHVTHFGGPEAHAGLVMSSTSRPQNDGKQRNGQTEATTEVGYDAVGDADNELDEEAGDDEEDNEEEVEEENVPGAKHIQGSRADLNPSFGVRTGESTVTTPSDTHPSANSRAFDSHTSATSRTHPSRSRLQIVPATAAYRRLGTGTLDTRGPVVGSGLQLSVSRWTVPDSHRTPILAAPKTSPTSGLVNPSSGNPMTTATSNQATSTSNSKCCTM